MVVIGAEFQIKAGEGGREVIKWIFYSAFQFECKEKGRVGCGGASYAIWKGEA